MRLGQLFPLYGVALADRGFDHVWRNRNSILGMIDPSHENYSDAVEAGVRNLVDATSGENLAQIIFDSVDHHPDAEKLSCLFDILLWFPGVDVRSLVNGLQVRLDSGDKLALQIVRGMDAGVDGDDPLLWIRSTFPECTH